MEKTSISPAITSHESDDGYPALESLIRDRVGAATGPLFATDAKGLWDAYLAGIPGESAYGPCNCGADRTGPSAEAHDPTCPANYVQHLGQRQHYNCVLPGAFIQGRVLQASKAFYSGEAVEITTRNGTRLSVTANHTVLTDAGFVRAADLIPGQQLLHYVGERDRATFGVNNENPPAKIDDVFQALEVTCHSHVMKVVSSLDLDGDGASVKGKIHIVHPDRGLLTHAGANGAQDIHDGAFARPRMNKAGLARCSALQLHGHAVLTARSRNVSGRHLLDPLLRCHARYFDDLGFAPAPEMDSREDQAIRDGACAYSEDVCKLADRFARQIAADDLVNQCWIHGSYQLRIGLASQLNIARDQPTADCSARDAELASKLVTRFAGKVAFADVLHVRRFHYEGPVFDLGTDVGYFAASQDILGSAVVISNCRHCRRFIERYGGLVSIDETQSGHLRSILWACTLDAPEFFRASCAAMNEKVWKARVTGVFLSNESAWGTPSNIAGKGSKHEGTRWTHLSGSPPSVFKHALKTAAQMMAGKHEDYGTLRRGLAEFPAVVVEQAVKVLKADALDRSEKTLGVAEWLLELHGAIADLRGPRADNIVWRAVATAPPGWCHVRSTMISTLLDDIVAGLDFDAINRRWAQKMHPLQYQRPTAPPTAGALQRAEKIVAELRSAGALERRFARFMEIVAFWYPRQDWPKQPAAPGGVFDHLKPKPGVKPLELPATTMTFAKFASTVLPDALEMEFLVPSGRAGFYGLVTAANADAPPLLQWDGLAGHPRCPVSWYFYHGGSPAENWDLRAGSWVRVRALCHKPPFWHQPEKFTHQGDAIFFVLDGCRDLRHERGGGWFPEQLRTEYHEIRSVMEAHAQQAPIAGRDEGDANGIALQKGDMEWSGCLRVRSKDGLATYRIDRWD